MSEVKAAIRDDLKTAMKAKDTLVTGTLRMLLSAIQNEETSGTAHALTDEEFLKVVAREVKKRGEAAEIFEANGRDELAELEEKIEKTKFTKEARDKALSELKKLKSMSPMSAEATVSRNYLDWLLALPWGVKSRTRKDLGRAEQVDRVRRVHRGHSRPVARRPPAPLTAPRDRRRRARGAARRPRRRRPRRSRRC